MVEFTEDQMVVEGYRKYYMVDCLTCGKVMKVRSDYVAKHSGVCISCQKKSNKCALKHGEYGTRLYRIWTGLEHRRYRRYNPVVCSEWSSYERFRDWSLLNGYEEHLTIDRINNDLGYSPDNCQWITLEENAAKDKVIFNDEEKKWVFDERKRLGLTQREFAAMLGVSRNTIYRAERCVKNDRK